MLIACVRLLPRNGYIFRKDSKNVGILNKCKHIFLGINILTT